MSKKHERCWNEGRSQNKFGNYITESSTYFDSAGNERAATWRRFQFAQHHATAVANEFHILFGRRVTSQASSFHGYNVPRSCSMTRNPRRPPCVARD